MKLTDAEREELEWLDMGFYSCAHEYGTCPVLPCQHDREDIYTVVESIVAARLAEQREALAAAIEQERDRPGVMWNDEAVALDAFNDAARIVREYQPGDDT